MSMPASRRSSLSVSARCAPAAEQAREVQLELLVDRVESLLEARAAGAVDARNRVAQLQHAVLEVVLLLGQEAEALAQLLVLLDRAEVHVADRLDLRPDLARPRASLLGREREQLGQLPRLTARVALRVAGAPRERILLRLGRLAGRRRRSLAGPPESHLRELRLQLGAEVDERGRGRLPVGEIHVPAIARAGVDVGEAQLALAQPQLGLVGCVAQRLELDP
jgi:hypothetical protein